MKEIRRSDGTLLGWKETNEHNETRVWGPDGDFKGTVVNNETIDSRTGVKYKGEFPDFLIDY